MNSGQSQQADLGKLGWAWEDLNLRPLPYQIVSHSALACSCPGQRSFSLSVGDRWQLCFSACSGTHVARHPHGSRSSDLLIRRVFRAYPVPAHLPADLPECCSPCCGLGRGQPRFPGSVRESP
jgi:hypothetical protein